MAEPIWAVSAEEIRALAAQIAPVDSDPIYGQQERRTRVISDDDIARWVDEVGAVVDVKLHARSRLSGKNRARVDKAAGSIVRVGAAAYLVDAAAPTRAGVNDNSSYGNVLWTRYRTELEELVEQVDDWIRHGGGSDDDEDPAGQLNRGGAGHFQRPIFRDHRRW